MLKKAEGSFYVFFGEIIFILQLWIWTTRSEFCEDTFTIYKDETLVISNGVTIQHSVSLAQCTTECRSNVKCSAASYSETTLDCHLDISGTRNFQKRPATGWRTIIRGNFGKYNKLEEFEDTKGIIGIRKSKKDRQHNGQKKKNQSIKGKKRSTK
jgi:hypothetical protein